MNAEKKMGFNDPFKCSKANPIVQQWKSYAEVVIQKHNLTNVSQPNANEITEHNPK